MVKVAGARSVVDTPQGVYRCDLRGRLFRQMNLRLAVGDSVVLRPMEAEETEDQRGVIEAVEPRRSALRRVRDFKRDQILCANVDRIFVVVAVFDPPYKRAFLDRLVVGIERDELEPFLVFNKIDLADGDYRGIVAEDAEVYGELGYPTLLVSAASGEGIEELEAAFQDRISAVVGPSGVGKSTLLNRICPGLQLRTGEVSAVDGRGRHTTTAAELVRLPKGGYVVDTPGLRAFGLWDLEPQEIMDGFREIRGKAPECRFRNCAHRSEPDCAVRSAVETGEIDEERYESYARLVEEVEATAAERQASRRR